MSATKHLNRQVRHRIWCRAWCIWMHGFHSPAGCIPSAAGLKPLACRERDNLSEGRSTSHKYRPETLHVLYIHISSDVTQQLMDCLVRILGHCKVIRLTWCHLKRKSLGDPSKKLKKWSWMSPLSLWRLALVTALLENPACWPVSKVEKKTFYQTNSFITTISKVKIRVKCWHPIDLL